MSAHVNPAAPRPATRPLSVAVLVGLAAALLAFGMSVLVQHFGFDGTDTLAAEASGGQGWGAILFTPGPLGESLLFALQAGLGGALLGGCIAALARRRAR